MHALALYCGASGDHNPIHVNFDYVKEAGLEDVIAHGMLSMGNFERMLTDWIPQKKIRSYKTRFNAMTQIGDTVSCLGRVAEKWEEDGRRIAMIELFVETTQATTILDKMRFFLD